MAETTDPLHAAFLGVLQGITEFLPVSSSGHLVLFQQFLEVAGDEVLFDLVVHLGTLLPVLWFYRDDVGQVLIKDSFVGAGPLRERRGVRLLALLVVATIPTAIIGVLLRDVFLALFHTPATLVVTFALTGVILFATRRAVTRGVTVDNMTRWQALALGLAQGFAITPGISRSGTTIAVALFLGFERGEAARFSFLMSVPAILGAVVMRIVTSPVEDVDVAPLVVGFLAAFVSGYAALVLLVGLVKRGGLPYFAAYCWLAAVVSAGVVAWQAGLLG